MKVNEGKLQVSVDFFKKKLISIGIKLRLLLRKLVNGHVKKRQSKLAIHSLRVLIDMPKLQEARFLTTLILG